MRMKITPAGPLSLAGYCGKPPAASWLDDTMTLLPAAFVTVTSSRLEVSTCRWPHAAPGEKRSELSNDKMNPAASANRGPNTMQMRRGSSKPDAGTSATREAKRARAAAGPDYCGGSHGRGVSTLTPRASLSSLSRSHQRGNNSNVRTTAAWRGEQVQSVAISA